MNVFLKHKNIRKFTLHQKLRHLKCISENSRLWKRLLLSGCNTKKKEQDENVKEPT